ncbi:hypothetical protein EBX93_05795, partial [bacterium]|nr:hypothetical protein [bacterium]
MLMDLGFNSLDEFISKIVPNNIFWKNVLDLPDPISEEQAISEIRTIAAKNQIKRSMIGMGYYGTKLPNVILRNVLENPAW